MNNWESKLREFQAKIERRINDIHINCAEQIRDSIKDGSTTTGAPGQPVDSGYLKNSWQLVFPTKLMARITTNVAYAPAIEENTPFAYDPAGVDRPKDMPLSPIGVSEVGGSHSVKQTRVGFQRIADRAVREVVHD